MIQRVFIFAAAIGCFGGFASPSLCSAQSPSDAAAPRLVEFHVGGRVRRGLRLITIGNESVIMGRDGWLHSLDPADAGNSIAAVRGQYVPISPAQMRNQLRDEFGKRFEVVATTHFLVVQPDGRGPRWPDMFEQSHRAFLQYMRGRGVQIRQGRFPMVAVVFPDSQSMYAELDRLGIDVSRIAGIYANNSNRVMTHDAGHLSTTGTTVRHEAAHQSAFNSGVHSRINDTPSWITEGVGQMFEPAAMSDGRAGSRLRDRINRDSIGVIQSAFGDLSEPAFAETVRTLVSSDAMFADSATVDRAYAVSWAMMFYMAERDPDAFAEMLNFTATRPPFQDYLPEERVADFERIAGCDTLEFSQRIAWFLRSI